MTDPLEEAFAEALAGEPDIAGVLAMPADREPIEVGTGRPEDGYLFEGRKVPSVTRVLPDRGDNGGLLTWAGREAIKAAFRMGLREEDTLPRAAGRGRFWAAAKAWDGTRDRAAKQGTCVHEAIQGHIIGDPELIAAAMWAAPDGECVEAALKAYKAWESDLGACIRWTAIEVPLVTPHLAGTPDMYGRITYPDGTEGWIGGDIKGGKYVGKKAGKQLGLYRWMVRRLRGIEWSDAVIIHIHASRNDDGEIVVKKNTPRFGGAMLDAYEAAGLAELKAYLRDEACPVLPGMWA